MKNIAQEIIIAAFQFPGLNLEDANIEMQRMINSQAVCIDQNCYIFSDNSAIDLHDGAKIINEMKIKSRNIC